MNDPRAIDLCIQDAASAEQSAIGHLPARLGIERGLVEDHRRRSAERPVRRDGSVKREEQWIAVMGQGSGRAFGLIPIARQ